MATAFASSFMALAESLRPVAPLGCIGAEGWDDRPPVTKRDKRAVRRAMKKPVPDLGPWGLKRPRPVEVVELSVLAYLYDGRCSLCWEPVHPDDASMDHLIPLAKGGDHTYNNVQFAHPTCNAQKSDMHPDEWFGAPPVFDLLDPVGPVP
jgi:5-methylcytosine-specific restriction endonuclease McrA